MNSLTIDYDDCFEYAIALSLLSRISVNFNVKKCDNCDHILSFIKIVSPQTTYEIKNGSLFFSPGSLLGGYCSGKSNNIELDLRLAMLLAPFSGKNLEIELEGITNEESCSTDVLKVTFFKVFRLFGMPSFNLDIKKRGFAPLGEGKVSCKFYSIRKLEPISLKDPEPIEKIRGFVITSKISADFAHRMINKSKELLSDLANTKILCIINNKNDSGPSPGYECSLLAESSNGVFYSTVNNKQIPEDMASGCCAQLLKNIKRSEIFDRKLLPSVIFFMGLAGGVSFLRIRKLDPKSKKVLDLLKLFFNVTYKINTDTTGSYLTVVGADFKNPFISL